MLMLDYEIARIWPKVYELLESLNFEQHELPMMISIPCFVLYKYDAKSSHHCIEYSMPLSCVVFMRVRPFPVCLPEI